MAARTGARKTTFRSVRGSSGGAKTRRLDRHNVLTMTSSLDNIQHLLQLEGMGRFPRHRAALDWRRDQTLTPLHTQGGLPRSLSGLEWEKTSG